MCSFSHKQTNQTKDNYFSYPIEQIVSRAQKSINEDVKEIWLVSQDTGRYGFDINTDLPTLIEEIVKLNGKFKLGIGVMSPDSFPEYVHEEMLV